MKISLLAALTFLPCLAFAQTATPTPTPPPCAEEGHHHHHFSPEQQLAMLTTKLSLSDTQQGEIKPILVSRDAQIKPIFENASLSEDQKHQQIQAIIESTNQQIEAFLNPAQIPIFKALRDHDHHGKPGNAPQP